MPLNKFGQSLNHSNQNSLLSKLQYGNNVLKYTPDGNIDAENLKICNVKSPTLNADATNMGYVDQIYANFYDDTIKSLSKFEQETLKALKQSDAKIKKEIENLDSKKQDKLKINLNKELAILTQNTDELKEQIKELNKQKTIIFNDLNSLKNISRSHVNARNDLDRQIKFLQQTQDVNLKDIKQQNEQNIIDFKKQIKDLNTALKSLDTNVKNGQNIIDLLFEDVKKNKSAINDMEKNIIKVITVAAGASTHSSTTP